jgi:hypothetical protein
MAGPDCNCLGADSEVGRIQVLVITMIDWMHLPVNSVREFVKFIDDKVPGASAVYFSEDESQFVKGVELILDAAIRRLEEDAATHGSLGELTLSTMLSNLIRYAAPCEKESYRNGHVDVAIGHPRKQQFQYLGECKIFGGFKKHCGGCDQLLNRYSSGRDVRGFVLEFFDRPRMYKLLADLKTDFDQRVPLKMKGSSKPHDHIKGAFISLHTHFTQTDVEVLHLGCNLYIPGISKSKASKKKAVSRRL